MIVERIWKQVKYIFKDQDFRENNMYNIQYMN